MVLTKNDMRNIVFATINEKPGEQVVTVILSKICGTIVEKAEGKDQIDEEEIFNDVKECMQYYNDFVREKNMELPVIGDTYFSLVKVILTMVIGEVFYENKRD